MARPSRTTLVKGPGALSFGGQSFIDQDGIEAGIDIERGDTTSSLFGKLDGYKIDQQGKISLTPLGRLTSDRLALLYPHQTPVVGASIFGASDTPVIINSRAGKKLTFFNAALTSIPELTLSAAKTAIGKVELTALLADTKEWTDADAFYALADEAFAAPAIDTSEIKRVKYAAAWGTKIADIQSKEGWTVTVDLETDPVKTDDHGTVDYTLQGVTVTAKCAPINLNEDLLAQMRLQGADAGIGSSLRQGADLTITGQGGLTVILRDAMLIEGPLKYGATELRLGEIAFVASRAIDGATHAVGDLYSVALTA